MKEFFKNLKKGMLLSALVSLALGLVMILMPGVVQTSLRFFLGGGLTLFGLIEIVSVFIQPSGLLSAGRMIPGILSLAVGLVFLFRYDTFVSLLWVLMGIAILIDAVYKLQYAFELKQAAVGNWWIHLLTAISSLILAGLLMIQPFSVENAMTVFAGIVLLVNALFDLVLIVMMSLKANLLKNTATVVIVDADQTGIEKQP